MRINGLSGYRISSINGNPYSMKPVKRIGDDYENGSGKPLVLATRQKEELYVKDFGELENTKSTSTGDFAQMLSIQKEMQTSENKMTNTHNDYRVYVNDTIGLMGYQNQLRDQLMGTGFVPFE